MAAITTNEVMGQVYSFTQVASEAEATLAKWFLERPAARELPAGSLIFFSQTELGELL